MYVGGGGVENCNKKLSVCVAPTVSGRGSVGKCIEVCGDVVFVHTVLCVYVVLVGGSGVGGTMCMSCSKSTLGIEPHSDSCDIESERVSHDSVSSSQYTGSSLYMV